MCGLTGGDPVLVSSLLCRHTLSGSAQPFFEGLSAQLVLHVLPLPVVAGIRKDGTDPSHPRH